VIIAYTGLPGGGKSLSAIADYVLPELRRGRHVFCNISGLSPLMVSVKLGTRGNAVTTPYVNRYLHRFSMSFNDDEASRSKVFRRVLDDGSVYYANVEGLLALLSDVMAFNELGSEPVVVLDECHEYLASDNWKALRPFAKYVSMARHYKHDLVLITQHISDIWEPLRLRVHETHEFVRGRLGFRTQYMERVYHGCNVFVDPASTHQRFNDKSLYMLYSSHDGGGKEHLGYVSIWRNRKILLFVFLVFFLLFFSLYNLRHGLFGAFGEKYSQPPAPAPEYSLGSNVLFVKYVVCGAFDCKATRPDGSVLTLPLDYASGRYPVEVRKYVPVSNSSFGPPGFGAPSPGPGVPHAPR
jgi:zona occludens toxin (predicted ATPase)